jgi:VanZ family protein
LLLFERLEALGLKISFLRGKEFWWYWLPPLTWCVVIVVISGDLGSSKHTLGILKWLLSWFPPLSPAQFNLLNFYIRKTVGHFGNYAFLFFLWLRAFRSNPDYRPWRVYLFPLALCLALALLDEGHQVFFASRGSSLWDVALDMSGATVAALTTRFVWTPWFRRSAK